VRVYAKHYVRQRQNNLTTIFNFNEREIIRPFVSKRPDWVTLKPVLSDQLYNNSPHVKIEVMSVNLSNAPPS
jgi:hypothetical protein